MATTPAVGSNLKVEWIVDWGKPNEFLAVPVAGVILKVWRWRKKTKWLASITTPDSEEVQMKRDYALLEMAQKAVETEFRVWLKYHPQVLPSGRVISFDEALDRMEGKT